MTVQDFEHALLARACWYEAHELSIDAMLCIAHTIVNLSIARKISVGEAIVEHQKIHSVVIDESSFIDVRDPRIARLMQRISDIMAPYTEDLTNGALYYLDTSKPIPEPMKWILGLQMVSLIGTIHFFKEEKA